MALVASVDYPNKRIYLSAATVNTDLDTLDIYREVRGLRVTTDSHRKFKNMIVSGGNIAKIPGQTYTAPYVQLLYGCRIVPYNSKHSIRVIRDTFTDDGFAGRDCFDRTSLTHEVDIDVNVDKVEVRQVTVGGSAFTVADIWQYTNRTLTAIDVGAVALAVQTQLADEFAGINLNPAVLAQAVRDALATELARIDTTISSRHASGVKIPANMVETNGIQIKGTGTPSDKFRSINVP